MLTDSCTEDGALRMCKSQRIYNYNKASNPDLVWDLAVAECELHSIADVYREYSLMRAIPIASLIV